MQIPKYTKQLFSPQAAQVVVRMRGVAKSSFSFKYGT